MILIRRADTSDATAIAHVQVQSWRTTYAGIVPAAFLADMNEAERAARLQMLIAGDCVVLVAERDQRIVGFAMGGPSRDRVEGCDAELYAIYLLSDAQRARFGTDLLRELARSLSESEFKRMDVWVLDANAAKAFYVRTGAHYAASKEIAIGGAKLTEVAYVWPDLKALAAMEIPSAAARGGIGEQ